MILYSVLAEEVLIENSTFLPVPEIFFSFKDEIKVAPSRVPIATPIENLQ